MSKKLLAILPIIIAGTIIFGINYAIRSTAIVNATVISTRLDTAGDGFLGLTGQYLSLINLTDTWPHNPPIDSTRSECPLTKGQVVNVEVQLQRGIILYKGNLPTIANMTLYHLQGIGYVRWNGCP